MASSAATGLHLAAPEAAERGCRFSGELLRSDCVRVTGVIIHWGDDPADQTSRAERSRQGLLRPSDGREA
jgi:hypothetical protein